VLFLTVPFPYWVRLRASTRLHIRGLIVLEYRTRAVHIGGSGAAARRAMARSVTELAVAGQPAYLEGRRGDISSDSNAAGLSQTPGNESRHKTGLEMRAGTVTDASRGLENR
jgi:hypothetical protein